jgi:hypothetical protein
MGSSWEELPYLDRIWALPRLAWPERTQLLEMHKAGVLNENELSVAALRALDSSQIGGEAMEKVMSDYRGVTGTAQQATARTAAAAATGSTAQHRTAQHRTAQHRTAQLPHIQRSRGCKNDALLQSLQGRQVRSDGCRSPVGV